MKALKTHNACFEFFSDRNPYFNRTWAAYGGGLLLKMRPVETIKPTVVLNDISTNQVHLQVFTKTLTQVGQTGEVASQSVHSQEGHDTGELLSLFSSVEHVPLSVVGGRWVNVENEEKLHISDGIYRWQYESYVHTAGKSNSSLKSDLREQVSVCTIFFF